MPGRVLAQADRPPASVPSEALPPAPATPGSDAPAAPDREVREDEVTDIRIEGNRRVDRPDSKTVAPDGTVRQEYKSGKCVKVREVRPDGAVKTTLKCD